MSDLMQRLRRLSRWDTQWGGTANLIKTTTGEAANRIEALEAACERLGPWMSAAMEDPNVCAEMKTDITAWFIVLDGKL